MKFLQSIPTHFLSLGVTKTLSVIAIAILPQLSLAQLPELPLPSAASGAATTAKFLAGSSADSGATFADTFASDQAIDVLTEIQPEAAHIGTQGNTYLLIVLGEQFFMRVGESYLIWDGQLGSLQAVASKILDASEPISIVEGVAFGDLGLANTALSVFLAYDTQAAPGELYFSGVPLSLAIGDVTPEPPAPSSFDFFVQNVSSSIIQSNCILCHSSTGVAASTALRYVPSSQANFQQTNHNTLLNYINSSTSNQSLILTKPQGISHGGGTRLANGSVGLATWASYVALVISQQ